MPITSGSDSIMGDEAFGHTGMVAETDNLLKLSSLDEMASRFAEGGV